jgi:aldose 1-epimerase
MTVIELKDGELTATVHPGIGGAVTALARGGVQLFRPASAEAIASKNALDSACYPLVPFSNRIENGKLVFRGKEYRMEPNMKPHPHPLHGHAFRGEWRVVERSATSATLEFSYQGDDFPSAYTSTQRISLEENALTIAIAVKNTGAEPMPAGLGLHPFFRKPAGTKLKMRVGAVWLTANDDGIPTERVEVPQKWDFSELRELGDVVLDHCFPGWEDQVAMIEWPDIGLRATLTAEGPMHHLVVYVPEGQDFFCVEPVTNMNDAFNRAERGEPDTGTIVLSPGESLECRMTVAFEAL